MKPSTRQSIFQKQADSVEEVKRQLKNFSKFLRRDFLAILVKMLAKELQLRTVREDWRTRTGMLQFIQQNWPRFLILVNSDTIFKWYCSNFESLEKLLSNRKFALYVQANWASYRQILSPRESVDFLKRNQLGICQFIEGQKQNEQWMGTELGQQIVSIIDDFKSSKPTVNIPQFPVTNTVVPKPINRPATPVLAAQNTETTEVSFAPTIEITSGSEFDDLEIEDTFDSIPFEYELTSYDTSAYDPTLISQLYADGPLILDEYQL